MLDYHPVIKTYARKNRNQFNMTEAEGKFWNLVLRRDMTGYRFLRQKCVLNYIIDFYCHKLKLGIEIDGEYHKFNRKYDEERTKYLNSVGIKIVRYTNKQVLTQLVGVIEDLKNVMIKRAKEQSSV